MAIGSSCTVIRIRIMYDYAQKLVVFITASPKRLQIYLDNAKKHDLPRVEQFCPTRWSHRADSVASIISCYDPIYETLEDLRANTDLSVRNDAMSLGQCRVS